MVGLATATFVVGFGIGSVDTGAADGELVVAQLTGEVELLQEELEASRPAEKFDQLAELVDELEKELAAARSATDEAVSELSELEDEFHQREMKVSDREAELDAREADLESRERDVGRTAAAAPAAAAPRQEPAEGCGPGQVDINTAGLQELQLIYEIGPARAEQIVALRPFRSVDDLTRVSGIAEGRLGGIKAQGVACVR